MRVSRASFIVLPRVGSCCIYCEPLNHSCSSSRALPYYYGIKHIFTVSVNVTGVKVITITIVLKFGLSSS